VVVVDFDRLHSDGFITIGGLLDQSELERFEDTIATLVCAHTKSKGIQPVHVDPFEDIFCVGGAYTGRLYELMERLNILQQITARVSAYLEKAGFFDWAKIDVPLVWPDIRADLRSDQARSLPVHQDFGSMKCKKAWRLWIPLRPSNEQLGSMRAYPGTHKMGVVSHNVSDPLRPRIDQELYAGVDDVVFDLPAGDAVLIDPLLFHASVPNASETTKFTLMIQIQDLASMIDPTETSSPYHSFTQVTEIRSKARQKAASASPGAR